MSEAAKKFKFKCCAIRMHGYFWCAVCLGVYHPSCLQRAFKSHIRISENEVYCSKKCFLEKDCITTADENLQDALCKVDTLQKKLTKKEVEYNVQLKEKDDLIVSLREEVNRLSQEMSSSQSTFTKQLRKAQDFEELAMKREKRLMDILEDDCNDICNLRREIQKLTANNRTQGNSIPSASKYDCVILLAGEKAVPRPTICEEKLWKWDTSSSSGHVRDLSPAWDKPRHISVSSVSSDELDYKPLSVQSAEYRPRLPQPAQQQGKPQESPFKHGRNGPRRYCRDRQSDNEDKKMDQKLKPESGNFSEGRRLRKMQFRRL